MFYRRTFPLLIALALLPALPAAAQTPAKPTPPPPVVEIKIDLVTARVADVENLGVPTDEIHFTLPDAVPQTVSQAGTNANPPQKSFLQVATGNIVAQLYQTLIRTRGKVVQMPVILTPNNVAATFTVDTQIPVFTTTVFAAPFRPPPLSKTYLHTSGKITIIPHITPEGLITLDAQPQVLLTHATTTPAASPALSAGIPFVLRTIPSGETLLISGDPLRTRDKPFNDQELLVFITPTLLPAAAASSEIPALMETFPPNPNQRWFKLPLQHTEAHDLIQRMHWQGAAPSYFLPGGVERVFPATFDNTLLLHSTVEGFEEMRRIVHILERPGYVFAPTLTYLTVPAKDADLKLIDGPVSALEISDSAENVQAYDRLIQSGHATLQLTSHAESNGNEPQFWFLPDVIADCPRLRSDDTLTLDFTGHDWNGPPITIQGIHRGDVLTVIWKGKPQVTFIKVDY